MQKNLDFPFDCTQSGNTTIQQPFAQTVEVARRIADYLNVVDMTVFELVAISYSAITMALKLYPMPCIRHYSITKWRFTFIFIHTDTLLFFQPFIVFWRVSNLSFKIIFCFQVLNDSGPEFYRLQLRIRLQPKRSTSTGSNSGLDSDSAALAYTYHMYKKTPRRIPVRRPMANDYRSTGDSCK